MNAPVLPEHLLSKMTAADRKQLGKAGVTRAEAETKYLAGQERLLQADIRSYLRLHEIWFDYDAPNKRRTGTKGTADFLFAYKGVPVAVEAKTSVGKLHPDQAAAHEAMRRNGWRVLVARSVADVQSLFRELDAHQAQP